MSQSIPRFYAKYSTCIGYIPANTMQLSYMGQPPIIIERSRVSIHSLATQYTTFYEKDKHSFYLSRLSIIGKLTVQEAKMHNQKFVMTLMCTKNYLIDHNSYQYSGQTLKICKRLEL